jgi:ketosteroid isomerase-like protein
MSNGVFMPTTLPTTTGPAMHEAYSQIFNAIQLSVTFTIDELVIASDQVAYALTRSNGTQTDHATGAESVETNREVFIFGREEGAWKIGRYMFNKPQR